MSDFTVFKDFGLLMGYSITEKTLNDKIIVGYNDTTKAIDVKAKGEYNIYFLASFNLDGTMIKGFNISTVTWCKYSEGMKAEYEALKEELYN